MTYKENGKYGIVTIDERKVTSSIYDSIETLEHKDGVLKISKNGDEGLIKLNGDTIIKPKYYSIYSDGYYDDKSHHWDGKNCPEYFQVNSSNPLTYLPY